MLDFTQCLPTPGPNFNSKQFFIDAALLVEKNLDMYLNAKGLSPKGDLHQKLMRSKRASESAYPVKLWKLINVIKNARNEYAHNLRLTTKAKRLERKFVYMVEKANKYNGLHVFAVSNHENRRQWRLYFAFTMVYDFLCRINGASDDFSISVMILKKMYRTLNHDSDI